MADEVVLMFLNGTAMSGQKHHYAIQGSSFGGWRAYQATLAAGVTGEGAEGPGQ
jgi:hypothetical protein